jgi:hypothetical protein
MPSFPVKPNNHASNQPRMSGLPRSCVDSVRAGPSLTATKVITV